MTEEVLPALREFLDRNWGSALRRALSADEPLVTSGIVDSFGLVDLSLFVEERFGVRIDASDVGRGRADTAAEIAALIDTRRR
ncbi:MAG TPA: phosphopantetheine-binding protein [Thermoanaerobaculia bacterium]|nr:phosphopantetheine-binding protein [Thermoanaerobaculia bacterium]